MIPISVCTGSRCSTTICLAVAKSRTSTTVWAEWRQSIFTNSTPTTRDSACVRKLVKKLVSISMMEVPAVVRIRRSPDSAITIMITMDNAISV